MADALSLLEQMRTTSGNSVTKGLPNDVILDFSSRDDTLIQAIEEAAVKHSTFDEKLLLMDENDLVEFIQKDFINFYASATVNPYVALAARGPWIVTTHGAVIHDNGGYGMLGVGHGPDAIISAMSNNHVMANVMTPSFSQVRLADALKRELGHTRGGCPFKKFICMNSGSESVTVALRISDVNSKLMTGPGGRHEGKPVKLLAIERAFHGRTDRPAQISHSCKSSYDNNLKTFSERDNLLLVASNDVGALQAAFSDADEKGYFIEAMAIEPVQGEGNPGQCIDREFYDEARRLTKEHGSMLLIDSIQAGIRGQGTLSIIDYEGFQDAEAPDLETWSKALNAGQYPLSVLGLNERASELYVVGIYGNTMTTNPRALETAIAVLNRITPELRQNIRERGVEFVEKLAALSNELPGTITKVQGTGLLISAELDPERLQVVGFEKVEVWCRKHGLGVIHGGENALRYTPHFNITSEEIDLVVDITRQAIKHFTE
ncbi:MAG: aminotransferase class III-fold pyridoxal phosphate-dependent enzyme [Candidatus Poseidoniaceae archaeon]|jgi:acetylornithine/succinyldiaminopimelate/putrescine aminotransferase|nr:aminotransferase class III-fold pyridoxal phosphate-dependent enzyme [Candidatus Poseidoniaceae archaeon]